jgi:hypothetical protein
MLITFPFMRWLGLFALALTLAACAGSPAQTGMRAAENKKSMVGLKPDMTVEQVVKLMGPPDKTEMYRGKNDQAVLTYLYITEGMDTYNRRWNETNYTPLMFVSDRLIGWGWNQLDTAAKRYEFVIKER